MKRNFPKNEEHREAFLAEQKALMGDVFKDLEKATIREGRIYKLLAFLFAILAIGTIILFGFLTCSL